MGLYLVSPHELDTSPAPGQPAWTPPGIPARQDFLIPMESIRPVRESELDELIDLLCTSHNPRGHERYRGYIEGDPTWRPSHTPVIEADGRLVSTLRIWDRWIHLGATPVRMGGIGGVTTHPDHRGRGLATRLMRHTAGHLRDDGCDLGLLFSAIPARFYLRMGWSCVPLMGFRAEWQAAPEPGRSGLEARPFDESRDLDETAALYQRHNAGRSGTLLRPRPYWDYAPSRLRGVLPTAVVRDGATLGGYINWERDDGGGAWVNEVAWESAAALEALVGYLLQECAAAGLKRVEGEIPHAHPFVDALVNASGADLHLTGNASMMVLPLQLDELIARAAPEAEEWVRRLPHDLTCRLLFGESSGRDLEPILRGRGIPLGAGAIDDLEEWFPRREVVFWEPDHF